MALLDFGDQLARVRKYLFGAIGRGSQIDFVEMIFLCTLCRLQPIENRLHLFLTDVDEWLDATLQVAPPCELALDLAPDRPFGRSLRDQKLVLSGNAWSGTVVGAPPCCVSWAIATVVPASANIVPINRLAPVSPLRVFFTRPGFPCFARLRLGSRLCPAC